MNKQTADDIAIGRATYVKMTECIDALDVMHRDKRLVSAAVDRARGLAVRARHQVGVALAELVLESTTGEK